MAKQRSPFSHPDQRSHARPMDRAVHASHPYPAARKNEMRLNLSLLAIGFVAGILSLKIFDKIEQRLAVRQVTAETLPETAWMKVKAFRANVYQQPHKKATPVGMYYKNYRFEIAGRSAEWVKIGPDRFMHLSDLEGIEKEKEKMKKRF